MKKVIKWLFNVFICNFLYRVKYNNIEKLDGLGNCLICPNHSSKFDAIFIFCKVNNLHIMAKAELFKKKLNAKVLNAFNVFPIRRGENDTRSIFHAIKIFKNSNKSKLLIYIEGEKVKRNEQRGVEKIGPVFIAAQASVPIVPVYVTKNPRLFSKVEINFGDPI